MSLLTQAKAATIKLLADEAAKAEAIFPLPLLLAVLRAHKALWAFPGAFAVAGAVLGHLL